MTNPFQVLDIVAKNQRQDDKLLSKMAQVSKPTRTSAFEAAATAIVEEFDGEQWTGDCAAEFANAALQDRPFEAYHRRHANETSEQSFGVGQITSRSLLLGRFGSTATDLIYGADNYSTCLNLSLKDMFEFAKGKAKILDVGCGDSIFSAEASGVFNFTVDGIDLHAEDNPQRKSRTFAQYAKNLLFAQYVAKTRGLESDGCTGKAGVRDLLVHNLHRTHMKYMSEAPSSGDCSQLSVPDSQYDGTMSSWLFMYLSHEQAVKSLKEMVRVTKNGGLIRICEGSWMQSDPTKGLPQKLEDVKGIQEIAVNQTQRNIGGLRIFRVKK